MKMPTKTTDIIRPMLASREVVIPEELAFRDGYYLGTPKIDGIRCLKIGGKIVSRKLKLIPNRYIQSVLTDVLPEGGDGEIIVDGIFGDVTSAVMSFDGKPDFRFRMFDYVPPDIDVNYESRMMLMEQWGKHNGAHIPNIIPVPDSRISLLLPRKLRSIAEVKDFEQECIEEGYEGAILRTPTSPYKCNRATRREEWMLKLKRYSHGEAKIIGFEERMHNANKARRNKLGRIERSSHQENQVPMNTLGALIVRDIETGVMFNIGTGFDDRLRKEIWNNRSSWKIVIRYKYFAYGMKNKPRHPVFEGVRHEDDM
jgi:DNA ligase-1